MCECQNHAARLCAAPHTVERALHAVGAEGFAVHAIASPRVPRPAFSLPTATWFVGCVGAHLFAVVQALEVVFSQLCALCQVAVRCLHALRVVHPERVTPPLVTINPETRRHGRLRCPKHRHWEFERESSFASRKLTSPRTSSSWVISAAVFVYCTAAGTSVCASLEGAAPISSRGSLGEALQ